MFAVCVLLCHATVTSVKLKLTIQICIDFYILQYQSLKQVSLGLVILLFFALHVTAEKSNKKKYTMSTFFEPLCQPFVATNACQQTKQSNLQKLKSVTVNISL